MTKALLIIFLFISFLTFSQKENINVTLPNSYIIYAGYDNVIKITFSKKRINGIFLECENCEVIKLLNSKNNEWLLRVSQSKLALIIVKNRSGKEIGRKVFSVLPPPEPVVMLDSNNAQLPLIDIPTKIALVMPKHVPLNASFHVRSWIAVVDKETFEGNGSHFTADLTNYIKTKKSGTLIFRIKYISAFGESEITEIFQYSFE